MDCFEVPKTNFDVSMSMWRYKKTHA